MTRKLVGRVALAALEGEAIVRLDYPPYHVAVTRVDGRVYAVEDACNHAGASLAEGWLEERCIVCPMHGYVFDLASGKLVRPRGLCGDQRTFEVVVEGDEALVYDVFRLVVA